LNIFYKKSYLFEIFIENEPEFHIELTSVFFFLHDTVNSQSFKIKRIKREKIGGLLFKFSRLPFCFCIILVFQKLLNDKIEIQPKIISANIFSLIDI